MFLTTSLSATLLNFFRSSVTVFSLPISKSSTFILFLNYQSSRRLISLSMSSLSTSAFKAIKYFLAAKSNVSMPAACSNYFLVA